MVCFSLLFAGCLTLSAPSKFDHPQEPKLVRVHLDETDNGFFLSKDNAYNLANNIEELRAYIKKLEELVKTMEKYNK